MKLKDLKRVRQECTGSLMFAEMVVETVTLGPMFLCKEPFAFFYIILTFSNGFSSPSTNEPKKLEILQGSHQKVLCKKFNLRV